MCDVIHCKKPAKCFYTLGEVKFAYCERHKIIPEKVIRSINESFYIPWRNRTKDAMPT